MAAAAQLADSAAELADTIATAVRNGLMTTQVIAAAGPIVRREVAAAVARLRGGGICCVERGAGSG